eukprot:TRINITY_DN7005_c0_g1_i4.p1 TRINITY_DN7005_c0_g1~~TRINITY_DN7005_c0_g1_i4.p1  ORF type:complete len:196 (+),score=15.95 TRINITY_DN7005_c0_g1_i4:446-1033(+)
MIVWAQIEDSPWRSTLHEARFYAISIVAGIIAFILLGFYIWKDKVWGVSALLCLRVPMVVCFILFLSWLSSVITDLPVDVLTVDLMVIYFVTFMYLFWASPLTSIKWPIACSTALICLYIIRRFFYDVEAEILIASTIISAVMVAYSLWVIPHYKNEYDQLNQMNYADHIIEEMRNSKLAAKPGVEIPINPEVKV